MKSLRWIVSYILVAALGLWMAFFTSMKFVAPAHSQVPPQETGAQLEKSKDYEKIPAPPPELTNDNADVSAQGSPNEPPISSPAAQPPVVQKIPEPESKEPKIKKESKAESVTLLAQDQYFFDPTGKRDPFKPFGEKTPLNGAISPVRMEPLEEFEIDQLQIVGILWDINKPRALIRTPKNDLFTVYKNSKIGRNNGSILAIREGEIVVSEIRYEDGKTIKETRVKEIKRDKSK
jgi:type IV pilus assembly protein PilP